MISHDMVCLAAIVVGRKPMNRVQALALLNTHLSTGNVTDAEERLKWCWLRAIIEQIPDEYWDNIISQLEKAWTR